MRKVEQPEEMVDYKMNETFSALPGSDENPPAERGVVHGLPHIKVAYPPFYPTSFLIFAPQSDPYFFLFPVWLGIKKWRWLDSEPVLEMSHADAMATGRHQRSVV